MTEKDKVEIRHNLAMAQHEIAAWKKKKFYKNAYLESITVWIQQAQDVVNKDIKEKTVGEK